MAKTAAVRGTASPATAKTNGTVHAATRDRASRNASVARAYDAIKASILSGARPAGSHIAETQVAASVGVSRTPVREALRRLESEGLVQVLPNVGAFVATWSDDEINELFLLREVIEAFTTERAVSRATPQDVAALRELADEMHQVVRARGADWVRRAYDINGRFHHALMELASSPRLKAVFAQVVDVPLFFQAFSKAKYEEILRSAEEHITIVHAIARRDAPWASMLMRAHLRATSWAFDRNRTPSVPTSSPAAAATAASRTPAAVQPLKRGRAAARKR